jgi:1,4-dihydroxy-2-naphthoate polyprenyltransferase
MAFAYFVHPGGWQWLFVGVFPLLLKNAKAVYDKKTASELDPYLKQMAISTLLFVLAFGIGGLFV